VALTRFNHLRPTAVPWDWAGRMSSSDGKVRVLREVLHQGRRPEEVEAIVASLKFLSDAERAAVLARPARTRRAAP
jgi:hypothetical protein